MGRMELGPQSTALMVASGQALSFRFTEMIEDYAEK